MPERDCQGCTKQKQWGCTAIRWKMHSPFEPDHPNYWIRPAALPLTILGETTYACPRKHLRENQSYWAIILKYYGMYKKGFLPERGSIADQSNKAIEIFRVLDEVNYQCDREEDDRRNRRTQGVGNPRDPRRR